MAELDTLALVKTTTTAYTPTDDYHPATKKYVDDSIGTSAALSVDNLLHIQYQLASGNAGSIVTGSWQKYTFNTVLTNNIPGVSLSSNVITSMPAGDYYFEMVIPFWWTTSTTNFIRTRLQDTTSPTLLQMSNNHAVRASASISTPLSSVTSGEFTLSGTVNIEGQYKANSTSGAGYDLGVGTGDTPEVYGDLRIWKVG